jgi:hypothetical protein
MYKKPSILSSILAMVPWLGHIQGITKQVNNNVTLNRVAGRKKKAKGGRKGRSPYRPGKLGLSAVSEAIQKDYGMILSRKERKQLAIQNGQAFRAYYSH